MIEKIFVFCNNVKGEEDSSYQGLQERSAQET